MLIKCPWCGLRPLSEFTYGGAAHSPRPRIGADADWSAWMDHVYLRDNPAGMHKEYWLHVSGCRSWLLVARDTTNHKIVSVVLGPPLDREPSK